MTDKLSGSEVVEKTFNYVAALTRECRKTLTLKFEREHRGIPFDSVDAVMRREVQSWFALRDKNLKLSHTKSTVGKAGEILVSYSGEAKDVHFKIQINGLFTLVGSPDKAPSYIKNLSLSVDKRDFTK